MKGNYPLTRQKLHRVLLDLLNHPATTLEYKNLAKNEGHIAWDDIVPITSIHILVDANVNPTKHLSTVLHELIHIVMYGMYLGRMTLEYQEVGVLAYEQDMYAYVTRSPARTAKWTAAIEAKLKHE